MRKSSRPAHRARKQQQVMLFGVFDRLHPGHLYALYHARLLGDALIAVVTRAAVARELKGRSPQDDERQRLRNVRATKLASRAVLGDKRQGGYAVIRKYKPDIIAVGYDQKGLAADLRRRMRAKELLSIPIVRLRAYQPRRYHTSLLRSRRELAAH